MQHSYKVPANIFHNFSFCLYQRSEFWHLYPVMNFRYILNMEYGGLWGYGWLTVFRQVQLSFVCLDNLGKINKSLRLSLWKLTFGKMAMFLLGKQWRFMSGGRVQPVERSLPGVAFLSWNELNETSSSTLVVHVTLLPILRPLFQSFFLVKLWTEDTSFTQVLQSGLWWGGSAQHTCILLSDAQGLPLPCSALKVPVFSQASFPPRCSPNMKGFSSSSRIFTWSSNHLPTWLVPVLSLHLQGICEWCLWRSQKSLGRSRKCACKLIIQWHYRM